MREYFVTFNIKRLNGGKAFRQVAVFAHTAADAVHYARHVLAMPNLMETIGYQPVGIIDWNAAHTRVDGDKISVDVTEVSA